MNGYLVLDDGRRFSLPENKEDARVFFAALFDLDAQPYTDEELEDFAKNCVKFRDLKPRVAGSDGKIRGVSVKVLSDSEVSSV